MYSSGQGKGIVKQLKSMTVGQKISALCAVLLTLIVTLGIVSIVDIRQIYGNLNSITTDSLPGVYRIGTLAEQAQEIRGNILVHIATEQPEEKAQMETSIARGFKSFDEG